MNKRFTYPPYNFNGNSGYCTISAIECFLPAKMKSNEDIIAEHALNINPEIVTETYGVNSRHIAENSDSDSKLLSQAAKKALKKANIEADSLGKLIVNKFFGDRILPMTASYLQSNLGMQKAVHSFDIDGGLISYFQTLDLLAKMPIDEQAPVLVASGGIINRLVNKTDARHAFLFGDGACASIISKSDKKHIRASYQITNPEFSHLSQSLSFKDRPSKEQFNESGQDYFYNLYTIQNWTEANIFVKKASEKMLSILVTKGNIKETEIDGIILGCFNKKMETEVLNGLKNTSVPLDTIISPLNKYGNLMSATLPVSIYEALKSEIFKEGSKLLFVAVGEGLSIGMMVYEV